MELLWPYVKSNSDLSVEGYLIWVKKQEDSLYQIKYEQVIDFIFFIKLLNNNNINFTTIDICLLTSNNQLLEGYKN